LPQSATAALLNLLRGQAATLTKEFRLTPVARRAVVIAKGSEVGAYALIVVHTDIIGTGGGGLGSPVCQSARWFPNARHFCSQTHREFASSGDR